MPPENGQPTPPPQPIEFMSQSVQAMIQLNEIFKSMVAGGFTETQACSIIGHMLGGMNGQ